jgi:hypothetical protein
MTMRLGILIGLLLFTSPVWAADSLLPPTTVPGYGITDGGGSGNQAAVNSSKQLSVQVNAAIPAGANLMGKVGIDQTTPGTTNLVASQAGAVRGTVGNVASGLLVGADCTAHCTPAAYVALPATSITFTGTLVSSTTGATTVAQTQMIYGANTNTFTNDDAVLICTITFPSATQYLLKAFTQSCASVTGKWLFYGVISSGTSGTATVTGVVTATY